MILNIFYLMKYDVIAYKIGDEEGILYIPNLIQTQTCMIRIFYVRSCRNFQINLKLYRDYYIIELG